MEQLTPRGVEPRNVASLPRCLDRRCVVVFADETDRLIGGYAVQHRKAGEGSTCPAAPSSTGDLDSFTSGS